MTFSVARDGMEIGEYPRAELKRLARAGELQPTDYYWREGMETWLQLEELLGPEAWQPENTKPVTPESPTVSVPTARRSILPIVVMGVVLLALAAGAIYFSRQRPSNYVSAPLFSGNSTPAPVAIVDPQAIQDKASAELRSMFDRLPGTPVPPLHTYYYGIVVNMRKTIFEHAPWTAAVQGSENVVDPETETTTRHTDFSLTIDYKDGEWTFRHYHASVEDMIQYATNDIDLDENTSTPPSIVGGLGLKTNQRNSSEPAVSLLPNRPR